MKSEYPRYFVLKPYVANKTFCYYGLLDENRYVHTIIRNGVIIKKIYVKQKEREGSVNDYNDYNDYNLTKEWCLTHAWSKEVEAKELALMFGCL